MWFTGEKKLNNTYSLFLKNPQVGNVNEISWRDMLILQQQHTPHCTGQEHLLCLLLPTQG
jgi:hypothetical protein